MTSPGTPKASQAAITAVQEALGCAPWTNYTGWGMGPTQRCGQHRGAWTERGCPVAVAAADAAAPHNAAQALREAADPVRIIRWTESGHKSLSVVTVNRYLVEAASRAAQGIEARR